MTPQNFWEKIHVATLAKQLNISRKSIYAWQKRKKIPHLRVAEIIKLYPEFKKNDIRQDLWD